MRVIRKPLPHQKNPKFCGISIKRDTIHTPVYRVWGSSKIPLKREVLILIEHLIHDIRVTISPSALSPHNSKVVLVSKLMMDRHYLKLHYYL